jgi:hypothetical protein
LLKAHRNMLVLKKQHYDSRLVMFEHEASAVMNRQTSVADLSMARLIRAGGNLSRIPDHNMGTSFEPQVETD